MKLCLPLIFAGLAISPVVSAIAQEQSSVDPEMRQHRLEAVEGSDLAGLVSLVSAAAAPSAVERRLPTWVEIVKALVWPIVAVATIVIFRKSFASFLEGLGQRATKLSLFKFEFELSKLPEAKPWSGPSLEELQQQESRWLSDSSGALYSEIAQSDPFDYAVIDLGEGYNWLTSRLFLVAAMLKRQRGFQSIVFLHKAEGVGERFLGTAAPDKVRDALSSEYSWLKDAYIIACREAQPPMVFDSDALAANAAGMLAQAFIAKLRQTAPVPPDKVERWTRLKDLLWEQATWINEEKLRKLLRANLSESWIDDSPDIPSTEKALSILRRKGAYVALVKEGRKFIRLVDRQALVEQVAAQFSAPATKL